MASLQGVASGREDVSGPAGEACKDGAEAAGPAANGGGECADGGETSNDARKNEPLHSAIAALSRDLCGAKEPPPFKGALRRRKKVAGLREAAL